LNSLWVQLDVYLYPLLIHSDAYTTLILLIIFIIVLKNTLLEISSASLSIKFFIVELLTFGWDMLSCVSYYLCFYIGIYASDTKFLVRSFNLLCPFSWSFTMFR
jgi:hypothetical protein